MRLIALISVLLAVAVPAHAKFSSTVTLTNHYIFRGLSQSGGNAAAQGSIDYTSDFGLTAGIWLSNTTDSNTLPASTGEEFDQYFAYTHDMGGWSLWGGATRYEYIKMPHINTFEPVVGFEAGPVKGSVAYTSNWFGTESAAEYINLIYSHPIQEKLSLSVSGGYTLIDDKDKTGFDSYVDYRVGAVYTNETFATEIGWWDTNREMWDVPTQMKTDAYDANIYGKISKTF